MLDLFDGNLPVGILWVRVTIREAAHRFVVIFEVLVAKGSPSTVSGSQAWIAQLLEVLQNVLDCHIF